VLFFEVSSLIKEKPQRRKHVMLKQQDRRERESAGNCSIFIQEEGLTAKNLITEEEKIQAFHLRHRIFAQELGWVPRCENGLERDDYDEYAVPFGVFDPDNKMLAHIRLVHAEYPLMVDKEFKFLISSEHKVRRENDTVEISRICVALEARTGNIRDNFGIYRVSMFLYKGVYHWCLKNHIRHIYAVVEQKVLRLLRSAGFPCRLIGEPQIMPDGAKACAVIMDWREFEILNTEKRPDMLKWFTRYQSVRAERQQTRPEACLQHQVFS